MGWCSWGPRNVVSAGQRFARESVARGTTRSVRARGWAPPMYLELSKLATLTTIVSIWVCFL